MSEVEDERFHGYGPEMREALKRIFDREVSRESVRVALGAAEERRRRNARRLRSLDVRVSRHLRDQWQIDSWRKRAVPPPWLSNCPSLANRDWQRIETSIGAARGEARAGCLLCADWLDRNSELLQELADWHAREKKGA